MTTTTNKNYYERHVSSITDGGGSTAESTAWDDESGSDSTLFFVTSYSDFEKLGKFNVSFLDILQPKHSSYSVARSG